MTYLNFYARFYTSFQRAGEALKSIFRFYPAKLYLAAILLLQIASWVQALFIRRRLSGDFLILHYNIDFGVDLVGSPDKIFFYPLIGLVVAIVNIFLVSTSARRKESQFITHLFFGSAVVFGIFLSLALLAIFLINFR
jgi:hypothetical protein